MYDLNKLVCLDDVSDVLSTVLSPPIEQTHISPHES